MIATDKPHTEPKIGNTILKILEELFVKIRGNTLNNSTPKVE